MIIRGWCPTVHEPLASGDGLLVRIKPFGGRLPTAALHAIADAAEEYGNSVIELTSRGNLQIRGLTASSAPKLADAMLQAALADPDPARERRRNVIVMPPYDDSIAAEAEQLLARSSGLSPKFCIAVGLAPANIVIDGGWIDDTPYSLESLQQALQRAPVARRSVPQPPPSGLLFAPFGQTNPDALRRLAACTDGARTTPFRAFYAPDAGPVAGFITNAADPRLSFAACPGAPACVSGTVPTRTDATMLATIGIAGVHVSGCAKGCARHHAGPVLVGRNGLYDLVRWGLAGDRPDLTGLTLQQAAAALA